MDLPVLMLTGSKSLSDKVDAFRFGANDYVTKPTHPQELLARVQAQLALKAAVSQNLAARDQLLRASKLQTVGRLAAGVAHEINTPAQYVSDNLHFLERGVGALAEVLAPLSAWAAESGPMPEALATSLRASWRRPRLGYILEQAPLAVAQSLSGVERIAQRVAELKAFTGEGQGTERAPGNVNDAIESALAVSRSVWEPVAQVQLELEAELPAVRGRAGAADPVAAQRRVAGHAAARGPRRRALSSSLPGRLFLERLAAALLQPSPGIAGPLAGRNFLEL